MLYQGFDTRRAFGMAHGARHVALLGPAAIAIHDDGNVLGQGGLILYGHELNASKAVRSHYRFSLKSEAIDYLMKMTKLRGCAC
jgi:hypothetical protein